MLAYALSVVFVQPGQTLSGIASAHGVSLAAVEQANPQVTNPNLIYVGEKIMLPAGGGNYTSWKPPSYTLPSTSPVSQQSASPAAPSQSGGGLSDVPGVPSGFAACVAYRESTNLQNPAANGNAYGIIPASGYNVEGQSLSAQKQAFKQIYDTSGPAAWAADGCPGT